jgi:predicted TIM-barrel fold metal-dependent hydrolase
MLNIVDSHLHVWDISRFRYPLCDSNPRLNRTFGCDDYRAAAAELPADVKIEAAVLVEATVDSPAMRRQTQWSLAQAADPDCMIAAVVAACALEQTDFPAWLEEFGGQPHLCGVRRALHNQNDELSRSPTFVRNMRSLASTRLTFDLCITQRQIPIAAELVGRCPDVPFVLDHCASPEIDGHSLRPWRDQLKDLAAFANVVGCKLSGLMTCAIRDGWTYDDLRPVVEHVLECFGAERVMFGSDWPVCTQVGSLRAWVKTVRELTCGLSELQRAQLFRDNAIRIYHVEL